MTQNTAVIDARQAERGHDFFPSAEVLAAIPPLYGTEKQSMGDTVVHVHYFLKDCHWWVAEYDQVTGMSFGFAMLHGDEQNAEWGYTSLVELAGLYQRGGLQAGGPGRPMRIVPHLIVERDLSWTPRPARAVPVIARNS